VIDALRLPEAVPPTMHLTFFRLARARVRIATGDAERGLEHVRATVRRHAGWGELLTRLSPEDAPAAAWVAWALGLR
jgi:hypothetical protein